ncbi:MAG: hypothetical protein Q9170_005752 [Blastenia crenularia]
MDVMWCWTNALYCAVCGGPFELPRICDHTDAEHENPAEDDESWNLCFGDAYNSRKLKTKDTEASGSGQQRLVRNPGLVNYSPSSSFYISGPASWERPDYGHPSRPCVPARDNGSVEVEVFDGSEAAGMLFPIHKAYQLMTPSLPNPIPLNSFARQWPDVGSGTERHQEQATWADWSGTTALMG